MSSSSSSPWSSEYENWYTRTQPHPSPDAFTPSRSTLDFVVLHNSQVEPEGFTLAVFNDKTAVDSMGRVLVLSDKDYAGLTALARQVPALPETGNFRNTWVIKHERTGQVIERILVGKELKETSVQGFVKGKTELKEPTAGRETLPEVLVEVAGLLLEGREGHQRGAEDKSVVQRVKDALQVE